MTESPLVARVLFDLGPVPITEPVITTWCLMAALATICFAVTRRLRLQPSRWQAALEILVTAIEKQVSEIMQTAGRPFVPLLGTLFVYLVCANLSGVLPGIRPPTASLETAGALALIVFLAVHVYGLRRRGLRAYLGSYARPTLIILPLNIRSEITRTFSRVTASPLDPAARDDFGRRLRELLGADSDVRFADDPALLAGAELHFPHTVLHQSWRDSLREIEEELRRDGRPPGRA